MSKVTLVDRYSLRAAARGRLRGQHSVRAMLLAVSGLSVAAASFRCRGAVPVSTMLCPALYLCCLCPALCQGGSLLQCSDTPSLQPVSPDAPTLVWAPLIILNKCCPPFASFCFIAELVSSL